MCALGDGLARPELYGPGVRVLNRGGFANPDVLSVERPDGSRWVVKDYAPRGPLARRLVAPLLLRHELAMLSRIDGLPGVPHGGSRVDALALAMRHLDGEALRRRAHIWSLGPAFFDALEGILEGIAQRGVTHLDLSSPSNVLVTPTGAPALVDLGGATALPLPQALRRWLEGRALAKLRRRFERSGSESGPLAPQPLYGQLDLGRVRVRFLDRGPLADPAPVLFLHDAPGVGAQFLPWIDAAPELGRRALAPDLPGFGSSRRGRGRLTPARVAGWLVGFLDAMRIRRVVVVGRSWGALVARALAARAPERVGALFCAGVCGDTLADSGLEERWLRGQTEPARMLDELRASLPRELGPTIGERLAVELSLTDPASIRAAWRDLPLARGNALPPAPGESDVTDQLAAPDEPERLFQRLREASRA